MAVDPTERSGHSREAGSQMFGQDKTNTGPQSDRAAEKDKAPDLSVEQKIAAAKQHQIGQITARMGFNNPQPGQEQAQEPALGRQEAAVMEKNLHFRSMAQRKTGADLSNAMTAVDDDAVTSLATDPKASISKQVGSDWLNNALGWDIKGDGIQGVSFPDGEQVAPSSQAKANNMPPPQKTAAAALPARR